MNRPIHQYKVCFDNNKAISSEKIDFGRIEPIYFERHGETDVLKWITIYASDKQKSIKAANEVAAAIIKLL